jgi:hypothetical protein
MMRSYNCLSFGFGCLATALLVIAILAMPTQGVWANDPTGGGPNDSGCADLKLCTPCKSPCEDNLCTGPLCGVLCDCVTSGMNCACVSHKGP